MFSLEHIFDSNKIYYSVWRDELLQAQCFPAISDHRVQVRFSKKKHCYEKNKPIIYHNMVSNLATVIISGVCGKDENTRRSLDWRAGWFLSQQSPSNKANRRAPADQWEELGVVYRILLCLVFMKRKLCHGHWHIIQSAAERARETEREREGGGGGGEERDKGRGLMSERENGRKGQQKMKNTRISEGKRVSKQCESKPGKRVPKRGGSVGQWARVECRF